MRRRLTTAIAAGGVVLCATVLWPAAGQAQEIKAGVSSTTISFSSDSGSQELTETERLTGFVGGVAFLLPGNRVGGVQMEALFHQKGARNLLRRDDTLRLSYLEVPVLLHVDLYQRGPRGVYVIGGVAPAFTVQASYEDDGDKEDVKDEIEDIDVGLVVGAGVELRRLNLEMRYTWGLRSAFQDGDLEGTFKNRALSVTVGYRFGR
jgi:hypothetical protein